MDEKDLKSLTINGVRYKLKGGTVQTIKTGNISLSADSDGIVDITEMFLSSNPLMAAKTENTSIASAWTSGSAYSVDQHVMYLGQVYKCLEAHTSSADFDFTKWSTTKVYDDPDYQMLYDGNTMHICQISSSSSIDTVWSDEYKKGTETAISSTASEIYLSRNGITYLNLINATSATTAMIPTGLNGYTRDLLLFVKMPTNMTSLSAPITWDSSKSWTYFGSSNPLSFTTSDAGKTFLYTFTEMPDGKFLVSRNALTVTPTLNDATVTAAVSFNITGTDISYVNSVQYILSGTTTTLSNSYWEKTNDTTLKVTNPSGTSWTAGEYTFRANGSSSCTITIA